MQVMDQAVRCVVCRQWHTEGTRFGQAILCPPCEARVVRTAVDDPEYALLVERFRAFWEGLWDAAAASTE